MRAALLVIVQILASLLIVGALMPVVLATMPLSRSPRAGLTLALGGVAAGFVVLRMVWPRPKGQ